MSVAEHITQLKTDFDEVYRAGEASGRDKEWNEFWDGLQKNGARTAYQYLFNTWDQKCLFPKYNIVVTYSAHSAFKDITGDPFDLSQRLKELGITMNLSRAVILTDLYTNSVVTRIPETSTINCGSLSATFNGCVHLKTIDKLILKNDGTQSLSAPFAKCAALEDIIVEGQIGVTIDFSYSSLLSAESMKSIVGCLKNYSGTGNEHTYRISFHPSAWERLEADSTAPDGGTWKEYVMNLGWST